MLNASSEQRGDDEGERVDSLSTPKLVEHIVTRHHTNFLHELPRIAGLASNLLHHLGEEEDELFPASLEAEEREAGGGKETQRMRPWCRV
jgi:iron-sulfur cluster repair protein YtfE (RIC family)